MFMAIAMPVDWPVDDDGGQWFAGIEDRRRDR
jgi:hypothetical protein